MYSGPSARPSIYAPQASAASASSGSYSRLQAKQEELEGLKQLKDYSAKLVKELEKMGEGLDGIRKGGESVADVMAVWQTVFRGIQVAQSSVAKPNEVQDDGSVPSADDLVPDTLVRIPVDTQSLPHTSTSAGDAN